MVEIALEMSSVGLTSLGIAHLSYTKNVHNDKKYQEENVSASRQASLVKIFKEMKRKRKLIEKYILKEHPELTIEESYILSCTMLKVDIQWTKNTLY
tara:strand:- start:7343 stop:7633 length:291 start_codon:yes stop_codon:yes gene_type:complete